ncbi:MAG: hydrolase [Clostridiales bacterium]|jgi:nicotinamidase-related amidase|nr:hydrolase [Clostridiales bacterium]
MRNYQESLLDPSQCVVAVIDHQPQMYFGVESSGRSYVENNVLGLVKAARLFNVPCILTTVTATDFSGPLAAKIQSVYPQTAPIDRTSINAWEDTRFKEAIMSTGKKKILLSGLWTEACVTFPALCMKQDGYTVYVVSDACAGASSQAHEAAMSRMIQAGVIPMTWQQTMLEWQRDWNDKTTYDGVMSIVEEHGGAYGLGVEYADSMVGR